MKLTLEQLRLPISALLVGGLLLLLLGQSTYSKVPYPERAWLILLMVLGAAEFLIAGRIAVRREVPHILRKPMRRIADYFNIKPGQIILLLLAFLFALLASLSAGRDFMARHFFVSLASWLIAIIFVIVGALELDAEPIHLKGKDFLFMGIIFAAALLLRGLATGQIPNTFSGDEGSAGLNALAYVNGEFNNIFTFGWFSFPSLFFGVQAIFVAVLGPTVEALRLSSAVAGALTVVAVYWLGRVLFNNLTGLLASIYLALSHYHIHMSRIALNNIWDGLFAAVAMLGLWDGWQNGRRISFIFCGIALGLGQYFYVSIRTLPILLLIWGAVAWFSKREAFRQRLPGLLLAAYAALIVALPLLILFARYPDEFNAPMNRVTMLGDKLDAEVMQTGETAVQIIGEQMKLTALGFTSEPLRLLYDPGVPLLLPLAAALFILGVIWGIWHFDLRYLLLFLPLIAAIFTGSISGSAPASQRYVMVMPIVTLFVAIPLAHFASWMKQFWPKYKMLIVGSVIILLLVVGLIDINYYFRQAYNGYVLGGLNTVVATDVAAYLQDEEPAAQDVYFFGFPRMGYYSHATIPYLAPEMIGYDIAEPLSEPPLWTLTGPTIFIFLPERLRELQHIRTAFPDGIYKETFNKDGQLLYAVYKISDIN